MSKSIFDNVNKDKSKKLFEIFKEKDNLRKELENTNSQLNAFLIDRNSLPVNKDRNLVSVKLTPSLDLVHTFNTGEQITTSLQELKTIINSYVSVNSAKQEVFINLQPDLNYPAVSYTLVEGTDYYTQSVNLV